MRHRATKERAVERREFVYRYREELKSLCLHEWPSWREDAIEFVEKFARSELEYKSNTDAFSIWLVLRREWHKQTKTPF